MAVKLGLIARDIHNSVTPRVYEGFVRDIGVDVSFDILNIEPDKLDETVDFACKEWLGFNITMPYKVKILEYADEVDDSAGRCGSCNVMAVQNGKLRAYNTDGWGFVKSLRLTGFRPAGSTVVLVGAGGVARSIAYNLKLNHVERVWVLNKFPEEAKALCADFGDGFLQRPLDRDSLARCCEGANLFVNASVLGQVGYDDYEDLGFLRALAPGAVVYDVNYSNPAARLPKRALEVGITAYNGKRMTVCQGIRAMDIWLGRTPTDQSAVRLIEQLDRP